MVEFYKIMTSSVPGITANENGSNVTGSRLVCKATLSRHVLPVTSSMSQSATHIFVEQPLARCDLHRETLPITL